MSHGLRLLLRVPKLHMNAVWATWTLQLLVLLVLGVSSLSWEPEVHMLIASRVWASAEAHRRRQINLTGRITLCIHTLSRPNQVILLVRELILLLVVHHW